MSERECVWFIVDLAWTQEGGMRYYGIRFGSETWLKLYAMINWLIELLLLLSTIYNYTMIIIEIISKFYYNNYYNNVNYMGITMAQPLFSVIQP